MGKRLVITEKPSVARDIAAALGGFTEEDELLESEDYVITWAVGHLLQLAEPKDYDPALRSWSVKLLPILPTEFQIKPRDGQKKRLAHIKKLGKRKDVEGVVNACDAGREGELIYRRIAEFTGLDTKPQERLWLRSMTPDAIRLAFDDLRPGDQLDDLADAAWLRSVGDWLVGMNATRALTQRLKSRGERGSWSAGRVQTPTLALLVQRERVILAHVPRPYWEIVSTFTHHEGDGHSWEGRYWNPANASSEGRDLKANRLFDRAEVDRLAAALATAKYGKAEEKRKKSKQNPPLLFDLTSLQREANKRFSMSAKRTLDAAQRLYEGHKLLTYPRTDSRYLPDDYGALVPQLLGAVAGLPPGDWAEHAGIAQRVVAGGPQNLKRMLDTSKVSDHFAIVPTGNPLSGPLSGDDLRVFDLVIRQFLAALMGPATWATVERYVSVETDADAARFRTTARSLEVAGFLEALGQQVGAGSTLPALVPGTDASADITARLDSHTVEDKQTRAPGRFSEAQLLRMMETAGEALDDDDLSEVMRDRGLGTPATRADTIEKLVSTTYARRVSGKLGPTSKAMRLLDVLERVHADALASPALTGEWEFALAQVAAGERERSDVVKSLVDYTKNITDALVGFEHGELYANDESLGTCPSCGSPVGENAWAYPCARNTGKDSECSFIVWKDRMGRFIDRTLLRGLLTAEDYKVGPLDGFVDRAGRRWLQGTLQLVKDDEKWVLHTTFGDAPEGEEDQDPEVVVGATFPCPHEPSTCQIMETNHRWVCREYLEGKEKRGPVLPKKVCHRDMQPAEAEAYFSEGAKTEILDAFTSRRGRPFRGALVRKATGKHGFEFPPREPRKGKTAATKPAAKKKTVAKKPAAKKKTVAKKPAAKKTAAKKPAAKKTAAKKPAAKKTAAKKAPAAKKVAPSKQAPARKDPAE